MYYVGREFKFPLSGEAIHHRADAASSLSARSILRLGVRRRVRPGEADCTTRWHYPATRQPQVISLYYSCPRCGKGDVPVSKDRSNYVCEVCGWEKP